MEIKINSNAEVSLSKLLSLKEVDSKILSYNLKEQTLTGDAMIYGKYLKKDSKKGTNEITVEFEEIVPFTVVFNRENVRIESVEVEDFKYELLDEGIKCSFVIEIEYDDEFKEIPIEPSYDLTKVDNGEEKVYEVLKEMNDEIGEITDEIDEKLDEFFEERKEENEKFSEEYVEEVEKNEKVSENEKEIKIENNQNIVNKKEGLIKNFKNEGKCIISIYYTSNPSDIEKISKQENIGIDKLYKDNENIGFNDRIIVKK